MILNRKKVMIVDPSPIFRRTLKTTIETNETLVNVIEADSIDAAEDILSNQLPDVVFLDIGFPEDGGMRLLEWIRDLDAATRIVVLTSHDSAANKAAAREKGADYFLSKEAAAGLHLIDVIHETIRRH